MTVSKYSEMRCAIGMSLVDKNYCVRVNGIYEHPLGTDKVKIDELSGIVRKKQVTMITTSKPKTVTTVHYKDNESNEQILEFVI